MRKILAFVLLLICLSVTSVAQVGGGMTDKQVVEYVQNGLLQGKSQQQISTELARRGVTKEQAERVKLLYEQQKKNGKNSSSSTLDNTKGRSRTKNGVKEKEDGKDGSDYIDKNFNFDDSSEKKEVPVYKYVTTEPLEPKEMGTYTIDRDGNIVYDNNTILYLQEEEEKKEEKVFGRDIFNTKNLTFEPSVNLATPVDYHLGPGDEVIIDIWGTNQATIRDNISPDGYINIEDIGLVYLNGLYDKCANAPAEELAQTAISQPAIMAVSLCAAEALRINGITATAAAGHSLGEYAAMVYTGMVSRTDGFKLIKARSLAMQKAAENSSGAMFAIIGSTPADIEKVCAETEGYVVPVNYNSSVQTVIAGEEAAAQAAADTLAAAGARAIRLNVAAAFHSKLMQGAADEFKLAAEQISFKTPEITMLSNISGTVLDSIDNMPERLALHIVSPVKFTSELAYLSENGYDTFVECGPGKVLTGLVKKTLKGVNAMNVQDADTLAKVIG